MPHLDLMIATHNPSKAGEISTILGDLPVNLKTLTDAGITTEIEETGDSYVANALLKANFALDATGLPSLGDDSGLEVDALGGRPGLYSHRYAPTTPERWMKLLGELRDVPWEQRTARFVCVVALALPNGEPILLEGECRGIIGFNAQGTGGFGYDPLFYLPSYGKTMAELPDEVKNRISHRGRAMAKVRDVLEELLKEK
jgi:XTP/dITP diphosphohydrolase